MQSHDPEVRTIQWEQPLGVVRGLLSEPGPRFIDPHTAEEREAIQEVKKEQQR